MIKEAEQQLDEIRNSFEAMKKDMGHKASCTGMSMCCGTCGLHKLNVYRWSAGIPSQACVSNGADLTAS